MFEQQPQSRILIVDDNAGVRRDLRQLLEVGGGFEVVGEAENGREAIHMATLLLPDVVVMDLAMPGLDGHAAAAAIKSSPAGCRLVALNVHSDAATRARALAAGFDAFVVKGAPLLELLGAIGSFANGKPAETGGIS